jgi:hypothetical protein
MPGLAGWFAGGIPIPIPMGDLTVLAELELPTLNASWGLCG